MAVEQSPGGTGKDMMRLPFPTFRPDSNVESWEAGLSHEREVEWNQGSQKWNLAKTSVPSI